MEKNDQQQFVAHVPKFVVDLDSDPYHMWDHVVMNYKDQFLMIEKWVKEEAKDNIGKKLGPFVHSVASKLGKFVNFVGKVYYHKELSGIAKCTGIDEGTLVLMQIIYEASTCCTSCVLEDDDGTVHHIRTMDWELDFLEPLTIEVDFQRQGKTQFRATTWAGYVGVLTGMRPGAFSVSVNFRVTSEGSLWTNVKKAMSASWPVGFLLREVLDQDTSYSQACGALASSALIAPVFYTIAGVSPGEGAIITRSVSSEEPRWTMAEHGVVIQTNVDHFMNEDDENSFDIMSSYTRRSKARSKMEKLHQKPFIPSTLWRIMSSSPILNGITVYGTYMCPKKSSFETRIPFDDYGFMPRKGVPKDTNDYVIWDSI